MTDNTELVRRLKRIVGSTKTFAEEAASEVVRTCPNGEYVDKTAQTLFDLYVAKIREERAEILQDFFNAIVATPPMGDALLGKLMEGNIAQATA